ncbi:HEPN domain-containing protein [Methylocella sp.]|uniref:HEPN domain-containing protein n=1 Tax=Methylocella sp. TaxID=1978226 RepID=UPI003783E42E
MRSAIEQLKINISRVRHLGGLFDVFSLKTTKAIDATDILRAQYVLSVSALDQYIHEITRIGMLEIFDEIRPSCKRFSNFRVSLEFLNNDKSGTPLRSRLEAEIRNQHSYKSFQHPDKIADAVRLFSDVSLWAAVAKRMGHNEKDIKARMILIVERRNKIAHEADLDPTYPNTRWPISSKMVSDVAEFIETVSEHIFAELDQNR